MIRLFKVFMSEDVGNEVVPTLLSGYIGDGAKVEEFEAKIGEFIGNDKVVAVNSCTSALTMALRMSGVGLRDYVVTSPMTCLAGNEAILSLCGIPLFADVNAATGNLDLGHVKYLLATHANIKAIMCTHWGGYPCDIYGLQKLASRYNVKLIEDAAQAFGAEYDGVKIGGHGSDFVCFSFQAIKHLTTGDGGALVVSNSNDKERAIRMRWFGLDRRLGVSMRCNQDPEEWGYKFHMSNIAASIGLANFPHIVGILDYVRNIAKTYNEAFKDLDIVLQHDELNVKPTYWLYTMSLKNADDFIRYMNDNGVECSKVHSRNDTKKMFSDFRYLPNTFKFDTEHVCIPCGYWLSDNDVNYIIEKVKGFKNG